MLRKSLNILTTSSQSKELTRCDKPTDLVATAQLLNRRVDHIERTLQQIRNDCEPTNYLSLSVTDRFYVYCVLVASENDEDDFELPSAASMQVPLAPTMVLTREVYSELHKKRLLIPNLHSPISAFNIASEETATITFDSSRVHWSLTRDILGFSIANLSTHLRTSLIGCKRDEWAPVHTLLRIHEYAHKLLNETCGFKEVANDAQIAQLFIMIEKYIGSRPRLLTQVLKGIAHESSAFKRALHHASEQTFCKKISETIEERMQSMALPDIAYDANDNEYPKSSTSIMARELQYFIDSAV
ncbi:hypothetical protein [Massilia timonae]|uniref:hypothetical protein n=1 Tax=Massilia timonae TaxID=47229 RepID=UPI0023527A46|nr:hypothetical protein [Massilia timonae]